MQTASQPIKKSSILLRWIIVLSAGLLGAVLGFWAFGRITSHINQIAQPVDAPLPLIVIILVLFGCLFLVGGVLTYTLFLLTNGLTFNFTRPVWPSLKKRIFLAHMFFPLFVVLGFGFLLSGLLTPVLAKLGLQGPTAWVGPVFATLVVSQMTFLWFTIWAPVVKRVINQRLPALGVPADQLATGIYLGLSDATRSGFKRFGIIEQDVGMLWFTPDQLIYWGDGEQWTLSRQQLLRVERKADRGSSTMLSGIAHVVLHVQLPGSNARQIRLHPAGLLTLGLKRKAMNQLDEKIVAWRGQSTTPPVTQPQSS